MVRTRGQRSWCLQPTTLIVVGICTLALAWFRFLRSPTEGIHPHGNRPDTNTNLPHKAVNNGSAGTPCQTSSSTSSTPPSSERTPHRSEIRTSPQLGKVRPAFLPLSCECLSPEEALPKAKQIITRLLALAPTAPDATWDDEVDSLRSLVRRCPAVAKLVLREAARLVEDRAKIALILSLQGTGEQEVVSTLTDWLVSQLPPRTRKAAADALSVPGTHLFREEMAPQFARLSSLASSDTEPVDVRVRILDGLRGVLDDDQSAALVLPLVAAPDTSEKVRTAAIRALGLEPTETVRETLIHLAQNAGDIGTRKAAIRVLSYNAVDARVISIYEAALQHEQDDDVRDWVALLMGTTAREDLVRTVGVQRVVDVLQRTAASDTSADVRQTAVYSLGRIDERSVLEPLIVATRSDASPFVRREAIKALSGLLGRFPEELSRLRAVLDACAKTDTDAETAALARTLLEAPLSPTTGSRSRR